MFIIDKKQTPQETWGKNNSSLSRPRLIVVQSG